MRRRLALLIAAAMSLMIIAFLVPLALLLKSVAADRAITEATTEAQSLTALVATQNSDGLQSAMDLMNKSGDCAVTVYFPNGSAVGADAPRTPGVRLALAQARSITVADTDGLEILLAVQGMPGGTAVVRAFIGQDEMTRGLSSAWLILSVLGIVLLALGVFVADRLARSIVRPVGELAEVSRRLAAGELDARARAAGPDEVQAVGSALNHLAARIRELIQQEREAIADISHRLRTPLTALRLDAESLGDPSDARRIGAHAASLEREVTALIEDARNRDHGPDTCDAAEVVAKRTAFWSVLAQDQDRVMTVDIQPGPLPVATGPAELAAGLDALLGNVFAHTPEGTPFAVTLTAHAGTVRLVVADEGPGFAGAARASRGASGAGSTGLGLDIARQTAEASGGSFSTADAGPGARIVLDLGSP